MIDSHTHIFEPEFDEDRREVLERACSAGVEHLILPNIDVESLPRLLKTHEDFPHNTLSVGGDTRSCTQLSLEGGGYWGGWARFLLGSEFRSGAGRGASYPSGVGH